MAGEIIRTAPCRFCGQMVQIQYGYELTSPQAEEEATMVCTCAKAVEYQKETLRKEKALQNVSTLFGGGRAARKKSKGRHREHSAEISGGDIYRRYGKGHAEPARRYQGQHIAE